MPEELHGQAVILDPDRLREQDPRYRELEKTDPQRAMEVGNPSANAWTIMLRNDAIAARANVIYETVMRDPKSFAWIVDKMAQTHRVELDVVATRPGSRHRARFATPREHHHPERQRPRGSPGGYQIGGKRDA